MAITLPGLKISVLHYQPAGEPVDPVVTQVAASLRELGHTPHLLGVDHEVSDLLRQVSRSKCDLVFNLCETFADDYRMEVNVAALLELARIPFTGSGTAGLFLAQDKILTKQLLEFHEVLTPRFASFDGTFETHGALSFPLIVKPARTDASIGIGKDSIVHDWDALAAKVREIQTELEDDALAEEFIEGRELYLGVIGPTLSPELLPIVELDFGQWDESVPKVANREVKFGPETKGSPRLVIAQGLSDELRGRIERSARAAYRCLKLRDYARLDFRVSSRTNEPFLLEVNPNPYLEKECEVALGARESGLGYTQLVGRIVEAAAERYRLARRLAGRSLSVVPAQAGS